MNREKLAELADVLESVPENSFKMSMYFRRTVIESNICNTAACVAGWTYAAFTGDSDFKYATEPKVRRVAAQILELSSPETSALFAPEYPYASFSARFPYSLGYITRDHAVQVVRYAARTGLIEWNLDLHKPAEQPKRSQFIAVNTPEEAINVIDGIAAEAKNKPDWIKETLSSDVLEPEEKAQLKFQKSKANTPS